ncbi:MAG: aspartate kinase [Rhabdochlamydiaceae bacterium]
MKFGGASMATPEHINRVAQIIENKKKCYKKLIVVVSAMGKTTDDLINLALKVHPNPPKRELDMLISVGERISMSLLAMALMQLGIKAISFTGSQSGIITNENHSEAKIVCVKPQRIEKALEAEQVVIVAGFQGVSRKGEITTLGRGGSDTTAVALGVALAASKVEFYKDVDGIYSSDPKMSHDSFLYSFLSYQDALEIIYKGAKILHARCVELAAKNDMILHVLSFNDPEGLLSNGTKIANQPNEENKIKNKKGLSACYEEVF